VFIDDRPLGRLDRADDIDTEQMPDLAARRPAAAIAVTT
jgi:hypothetical protein